MNHLVIICRAAICSPALFLLSITLLAGQAPAAGVQITPTRVNLDGDQRVVALTLSNNSNRDFSFQTELSEWTQTEEGDHYEPTSDLLVTPPIFTVPAGELQILRIGLRRPPDRDRELSYRLFIQELPEPTPEGFIGLKVVLRMSLPVFVAPPQASPDHDLSWQLGYDEEGQPRLEVRNRGNGHAQITNLALLLGDRQIEPGSMFYVLPDSRQDRPLPDWVGDHANIEVSARINGNPITTRLQVE